MLLIGGDVRINKKCHGREADHRPVFLIRTAAAAVAGAEGPAQTSETLRCVSQAQSETIVHGWTSMHALAGGTWKS